MLCFQDYYECECPPWAEGKNCEKLNMGTFLKMFLNLTIECNLILVSMLLHQKMEAGVKTCDHRTINEF